MKRAGVLAALAAACAACGSGSGSSGRTSVVAAFYPLAYAAQAVGGPAVAVDDLTPPGAEPHDVELTPRAVADLQRVDVVFYLGDGFQPAVERAVEGAQGKRVDLVKRLGARGSDPHVWLDPVLYARVVRRIGRVLAQPARADALAKRVLALDRTYRRGLAHCERRHFVTSHAAFGYLARRYGLRQIAITGVDPESEPSARKLAALAKLVRRDHVTTVFFERLVSPRLANTLARASGARTAVLDPIEGLTPAEASRGVTYLTLMRRNLHALRTALGCR
jgi:zinc transport system substrate-binding protein